VIKNEGLIENAQNLGDLLKRELARIPNVEQVAGRGLLLGVRSNRSAKICRDALLENHKIVTGTSANPDVLRLLPPLCIDESQVETFVAAMAQTLE